MLAVVDNDVVHEVDTDQLATFHKSSREIDVLGARLRIAARVVVDHKDSRCGSTYGGLHNLARMHERSVEASNRDGDYSDDEVLGQDAPFLP